MNENNLAKENLLKIVEYCVYAIVIGAIVGFVGTELGKAISEAVVLRNSYPWIIWCLPIAGVIIVFLYHLPKGEVEFGATKIISSINSKDEGLPFVVAPLIFVATALTHLCGGSAGREGAALLLGASLADTIGRLLKLKHRDMRIISMCGMAAGFTALFGTPVAATVFALEIIANKIRYAALLPVMLSAISAKLFAQLFGAEAEAYEIANLPSINLSSVLKVCVLGALTAAISIIMCLVLEETHDLYKRFFKNAYVRVIVGGIVVAALTMLLGPETFAGAGGNIIEKAIEGECLPYAFIVKIILTALTLGAGFKGGEIVPTLYVGATFGCLVGPLFGLDPGFAAAMAMLGNFAGNTNCPLAALLLAIELFDGQGVPYFALAIFIAYTLSGKFSLYSDQKLMKNKFSID